MQDNALKKIKTQFETQKKKTIMAICLVILMIFMWIRALGGGGPKQSKGESPKPNTQANTQKKKSDIDFVKLPIIKGRHDVLARDYFASKDGNLGDEEKVSIVSEESNAGTIKRIAKALHIQAISLGKNPQAFINDKLVFEGDKLDVKIGSQEYSCTIDEIYENRVSLKCMGNSFVLEIKNEQ